MKKILSTILLLSMSLFVFAQKEKGKYASDGKTKIGKWIYYYDDARTKVEEKGKYNKYGKKVGEWKYFFKDGRIRITEYSNKYIASYFEEFSYEDGIRNGYQKVFDKKGTLSFKGEYNMGKRIGPHIYYHQNGKRNVIYYYENNKQSKKEYFDFKGNKLPEGVEIKYYDSGKKKTKIFYNRKIKGLKQCGDYMTYLSKGWYENGNVKYEYILEDKLDIEPIDDYGKYNTYYSNGKLKKQNLVKYEKKYGKNKCIKYSTYKTETIKEYDKTGKHVKGKEQFDYYFRKANEIKKAIIPLKSLDKSVPERIHALYLRSAKDHNNAKSMGYVADNYIYGDGVQKDVVKAIMWYEKAIENGSLRQYGSLAGAKEELTLIKEKKLKLLKASSKNNLEIKKLQEEIVSDYTEQLGYLKKQYKNGKDRFKSYSYTKQYAPFLKNVLRYYKTLKIEDEISREISALLAKNKKETEFKKYKKQFDWMLEQVRAGKDNGKIQYNLGVFYGQGLGVAKDLNKAVYWSNKSAENGGGIDGYVNAAAFTLEPEGKIIKKMNSLGDSEEDDKKWNLLEQQRMSLYRKAIVYYEKIYTIEEGNTPKNILKALNSMYKILKTDTEISKKVKKLVENN